MGWLYSILGDYTRFFIICAQETITLFLYSVALTWYKKKRRLYILRLIACFLVSLALSGCAIQNLFLDLNGN